MILAALTKLFLPSLDRKVGREENSRLSAPDAPHSIRLDVQKLMGEILPKIK